MIVCPEIKQKKPQDRKTVFETLSLPVAKILSPVARQVPTKPKDCQRQKKFQPKSTRQSLGPVIWSVERIRATIHCKSRLRLWESRQTRNGSWACVAFTNRFLEKMWMGPWFEWWGTVLLIDTTHWPLVGGHPKGPKIEKIQDLENFKRDWKFQARCAPDPYFLWGLLKVGIENFKRDWNFQAGMKISIVIEFSIFGPLGQGKGFPFILFNIFNLWPLRARKRFCIYSLFKAQLT